MFFLLFGLFILLCTGMCGVLYLFYLLEGGMGINLGCAERSMPQKFLDGTYVGSVIEHRGGKGMAEHVRRVLLERADLSHTCAHDSI